MGNMSIKEAVKERFAGTVKQSTTCGCSQRTSLTDEKLVQAASKMAGYSDEELKRIPDQANLGLGCGNPIAFVAIKEGDAVLDLGSGAGLD
jgi:arsenite methyltransferase